MNYLVESRLKSALLERKSADRLREMSIIKGIDFCSNDYLGLAQLPLISTAFSSGSTGARLISGHNHTLSKLEQDIAAFHGFERALLFSSGYVANMGLLACLGGHEDVILSDEFIHASLIDGVRLSYAKRIRFAHNNLNDLESKLESMVPTIRGQIFVVVESLYSMDGDEAPLTEISQLCQTYNAAMIVDEAHAIGIYGPEGRGLVSALGLEAQTFAAIFTFGKAVGLHGAAIAGTSTLHEYLVNFCRPFIYSTAPAPQVTAATAAAYSRFTAAEAQRQNLRSVMGYFDIRVKDLALKGTYWLPSTSPIQVLVIPGNAPAKKLASHLQNNGFAIKAILSPTVPEGKERLRISLHSFNTKDDIDGLALSLKAFFERKA